VNVLVWVGVLEAVGVIVAVGDLLAAGISNASVGFDGSKNTPQAVESRKQISISGRGLPQIPSNICPALRMINITLNFSTSCLLT